jgi:hypothetical protein
MVLVKNEELALFSGKEMVWDAGYVLHVCKDDEKMVSTKRGGGCPVDEHGTRGVKLQVMIQGGAECRGNLSSDVRIVASISNLVVVASYGFVNSVSLNLDLTSATILDNSVSMKLRAHPFYIKK